MICMHISTATCPVCAPFVSACQHRVIGMSGPCWLCQNKELVDQFSEKAKTIGRCRNCSQEVLFPHICYVNPDKPNESYTFQILHEGTLI